MISVWKNVVESGRVSCTNCTTLCSRDFLAQSMLLDRAWKETPADSALLGPAPKPCFAHGAPAVDEAAQLYGGIHTGPHLRPSSLEEAISTLLDESYRSGCTGFESSSR